MSNVKTIRFVAGAETGIFFDVLEEEEFTLTTFDNTETEEAVREQIRIGRAMASFLRRTSDAINAELDDTEKEFEHGVND